ncbi:MAG TPA: cytochrome c [Casimicrobiaceae bacterium]|nr:cytochrome c [Casimicrobiaceae bacterium]
MMRATMSILLGAAAVLALPAAAADLSAGQAKAKEVCQACHGLDGNSTTADYPKLAGQYPDYLAKALRDYQAGRRKNPIMGGMAAPLTAKDIDNVAAYYAAQPAVLSTKPR